MLHKGASLPKRPENDIPDDTAPNTEQVDGHRSAAPASVGPISADAKLFAESVNNRLERLDMLSRALHKQIREVDEKLADGLTTIGEELTGLRHDIAELFGEFRKMDFAATAGLYEAESHLAKQSRHDSNSRLTQVENRRQERPASDPQETE